MNTPHFTGGDMLGTADEAERMERLREALARLDERASEIERQATEYGWHDSDQYAADLRTVIAALAENAARKADQEAG